MVEALRELGGIQFQQQELQDSKVSLERWESLKIASRGITDKQTNAIKQLRYQVTFIL